jgi:hypothetical protein
MPYKDATDKGENQRRLMRERRAGERSERRAARALTVPKTPFTAREAADVRDLLLEQVNAVRADAEAGVCERARVIGYLSGTLLRAIEAHDLLGRMEALEAERRGRAGA